MLISAGAVTVVREERLKELKVSAGTMASKGMITVLAALWLINATINLSTKTKTKHRDSYKEIKCQVFRV